MIDKPDRQRRRLLKLLGAATLLPTSTLTAAVKQAEPMRYRAIPKSGERLPVIGIGTSRVFDVGNSDAERAGPREALEVLGKIKNAMLDTSPMYGEAERVTGDLTVSLGIREQLFFASKVWTSGREAGIAQMNESLRRMRTECMDLMQIHNLVDWQTQFETLREWKDQGRIRYVGVTHYHVAAHDELERVMKAIPLDFVQLNYSLLEPEASESLLPLAADKGIAVIANRPFARAALFRKTRDQALPEWAAEFDCQSWAQFFLKWIIAHPSITLAIPGTGKARHMVDNLGAGQGRLPSGAMRQRMQALIQRL